MSIISTTEGATVNIVESFLDELDDPLILANTESGPFVIVLDQEKHNIYETFAVPAANGQPGDWSADIPIPEMGLTERQQFTIVFSFFDEDGDTHKARQSFYVEPSAESRDADIIVITGRDTIMQFGMPVQFKAPINEVPANVAMGVPAVRGVSGDELVFHLYRNNAPMWAEQGLDANDPTSQVKTKTHIGKTTITLPATVGQAKLEPLVLLARYMTPEQMVPTTYTYKVWPITPSILGAASQLEDYLNKARIENVIPELDYTQADLVQYLHRGLALFNAYAPRITAFTGTNMQGPILDSWLLCASYYALSSQLQAEGAMAFDFGGQSVSLNVDRTPAIESALGRVEGMLEQLIKPTKKLLAKAGVLDGDGSDGGSFIDGSTHLGTLGIINAPTTKVHHRSGQSGQWFRSR